MECSDSGFCLVGPSCEPTVTGVVEVGTLQLPCGGMIGVCVRPDPIPEVGDKIRDLRTQMPRDLNRLDRDGLAAG
jgi:hypothetical protein